MYISASTLLTLDIPKQPSICYHLKVLHTIWLKWQVMLLIADIVLVGVVAGMVAYMVAGMVVSVEASSATNYT